MLHNIFLASARDGLQLWNSFHRFFSFCMRTICCNNVIFLAFVSSCSVGCCKDHWLWFIFFQNDDILCLLLYDRSLSVDCASSIDRSVGLSVDGAYLLAGMHIRKWRAEKNGDLELIPKTGRSLATDLRGRWAVRVNDATLLLVNENPTLNSFRRSLCSRK